MLLMLGAFPRELLTFIHPSPASLLTSASFYPILHQLLSNFWAANIQDADGCRLGAESPPQHQPLAWVQDPPRTPSPKRVVFENSKASPIRSSGAAERWRGTGAVTAPP